MADYRDPEHAECWATVDALTFERDGLRYRLSWASRDCRMAESNLAGAEAERDRYREALLDCQAYIEAALTEPEEP